MNAREIRRGNQECTIRGPWQHWTHKTENEENYLTKHNTEN